MAYNEALADRVRGTLVSHTEFTERKMFGGIAFMLGGHMCCGVINDDLMVRVGPERHAHALTEPHVRPMDFTGRPMVGMVFVGPGGWQAEEDLARWAGQATDFASTLPPKAEKPRRSRPRPKARPH